MDVKEAADCIRQAQQNNQLVVFVGAGVSKNSGLPTWKELTAEIAGQMDWQQEDGSLSQEAFLRIAEYFYNQNQDAYYALIKKLLSTETAAPNPIDDAIFELFPRHIITTNYDDLLERSNSVNAALYTVVTKDSDLISRASERYLIKMHGDVKTPETIVLKESDYTVYEQRHVLISTFVRALLINHTFVFLGYALDDYNLNLILGWINYFSALYHATARPKNFLISTEPVSGFEVTRLEQQNIEVVDLTQMPQDMREAHAVPRRPDPADGQEPLRLPAGHPRREKRTRGQFVYADY